MEKIDIKSLQLDQLKEYITSLGAKAFVAGQIYTWLHEKNVDTFEEMTNISKTSPRKTGRRMLHNNSFNTQKTGFS